MSSLRAFAAALVDMAPRRVVQTAVVAFGLSATEGVGLLLLVSLLQLVGIDTNQQSLSRIVDASSAVYAAIGLTPSLGIVLTTYVAIVGAQGLLQRFRTELGHQVEREVVTTLRRRAYRAIVGMKWTAFTQRRQSDYIQILTTEIDRVGSSTHVLMELVVVGATALVYAGLAARVSPSMTALVIVCGALLAVTARERLGTARRSGERYTRSSAQLYAAVSDHLNGLRLAKSYGSESRHADVFARMSNELADVGLDVARSYSTLRFQLALGSAAVLAGIVYVSYTMLAVSTAQLLLLLFLFGRLMPRLTNLYEKAQLLATLLPAYAAVAETEARCLEAAEPPTEAGPAISFQDRIELERVTFDYGRGDERPALQEIDLAIVAGTTTAIVGPSGSGKSTLADLLLGLLEPTRGRLLLDGKPLTRATMASWREGIGYVPQDTFLLHDTVKANLLWANPHASDADLWRCLNLSAAETFVRALPQGLDTMLGDRGVLISGGERQRLSLARALLRTPRILILDEATSSLDSENEERIREALQQLHHKMTIVVITHRLAAIRGADVIHVIDAGAIVESGTWDSLLARRTGRFRALYEAQDAHAAAVR